MQLRQWRLKKNLSQQALAEKLEAFAREYNNNPNLRLKQSTLGYWERGTLPRKGWLTIVRLFTKNQVTPGDFLLTENVTENASAE